jgi:predicted AlkP superfamily pyrophosphatase or phosphodiesterase
MAQRYQKTASIYEQMLTRVGEDQNAHVYLRDKNMPEKFHFSHNDRIAPIWVVPEPGWAVIIREEFDIQRTSESGETYHSRGFHGYDNEDESMRAIFVARGPAFPHEKNSKLEIFREYPFETDV